MIPPCPPNATANISNAACSQGYDDGGGGAVLMRDGSLRVIDCYIAGNEGALLGPDIGGGAFYIIGSNFSWFVRSTLLNNRGANAGAVGLLQAGAAVIESIFDGNIAAGSGANNNDPARCTCWNNGQWQTGSGGNGGALYKDGGPGDLVICGSHVLRSSAGEFGAAAFLTGDGSHARLVITDSLFVNNTGNGRWEWCDGVSTDNPHATGNSETSPPPANTTFCSVANGCTTQCHT